ALSFLGVSLVVTQGDPAKLLHEPQSFAADGLILAGALCWVIYTVGATCFPTWSPLRYTTITTLLGLPAIWAVTLIMFGTGVLQMPPAAEVRAVLPHLAYMAVFAGFTGVLLWNLGNRILTPLNGVLFMDVVPLTAFIVSSLQGIVPSDVQV